MVEINCVAWVGLTINKTGYYPAVSTGKIATVGEIEVKGIQLRYSFRQVVQVFCFIFVNLVGITNAH